MCVLSSRNGDRNAQPGSANHFGVPSAKLRSIHGDDAVVDGHGMARVRLGCSQIEKGPLGKKRRGVKTMTKKYWILEERNFETPKIKQTHTHTPILEISSAEGAPKYKIKSLKNPMSLASMRSELCESTLQESRKRPRGNGACRG